MLHVLRSMDKENCFNLNIYLLPFIGSINSMMPIQIYRIQGHVKYRNYMEHLLF